MAQQSIRLPSGGGITISGDAADKLIRGGDGRSALVYIFALRAGREFTASDAAEALKMTQGEVDASVAYLRSMGLVESPVPTVEVRQPVNIDLNFKMLVGETQRRFGRTLSSGELETLTGIYHDQMLPCEVISILISHCIERTKARLGEKRMPTLKQIEKEALVWADKGIITLDAATEHLKSYAQSKETMSEVIRLLGIGGRSLTSTEQSYIVTWLSEGFGAEEIGEAYERTVLNTGGLKWQYMLKIMESWHNQGLHTLKDIKEKDRLYPGKKAEAAARAGDEEKDAVLRLQKLKKPKED